MKIRLIAGAAAILAAGGFVAGSTASGAGAGTRSGTLHLIASSMSLESSRIPTVVMGPITAKGFDQPVDDNHDVFTFPKGKLFVRHHPSSTHQEIDRKNCVESDVETGTYTI